MIIDCISDLHGHYPKLEGGDLLIIAGDLTAKSIDKQHANYIKWQYKQNYKKIVFIAGNHDTYIQNRPELYIEGCDPNAKIVYLQDSGTEFEGLKIWGSPWTAQFEGMNPHCMAFTEKYGTDTDYWLEEHWLKIPKDIDILITHCPPYGIFDSVNQNKKNQDPHTGSKSLREYVFARIKPKLHVFGHIHEWGGKRIDSMVTKFVNASIVNENYEPVNNPVRIIL